MDVLPLFVSMMSNFGMIEILESYEYPNELVSLPAGDVSTD